jgi:hypothetical protein
MTLIGPKRTFGKGESREQNAIIKVYSAAELKVALTKVYGLPNGVGTIQIAGDITITEPIKLRQFVFGESAPREIIIQSVGGARIYNGNTTSGSYNYNQAGNTEIPVFDFGVCTSDNKVTKYTFKDLIINNDTSKPFGAFIGADLNGLTYPNFAQLCTLTITNLKLHNVCNVYGVYDSTNTFNYRAGITCYSARIEGLLFRNVDVNVPSFNLANVYFYPYYGLFSNISVWNLGQRVSSNDHFVINTNYNFVANTFSAISGIVDIIKDPRNTNITPENGFGNTITGCEIGVDYRDTSFSFINCQFGSSDSATLIPTKDTDDGLVFYNNAIQQDISGTVTDNDFVVKQTFTKYAQGVGPGATTISFSVGKTNCNYEVNWYLSVRERSTGLCNTYHIKTNLKRGASGNPVVVSNTTVAASEEFFTLTGLIPSYSGGNIQIAPNAGAGNKLDAACTVEINGYKIFTNLI